MNIVICEDSISDRHKLEKVITKVLIKNNLNSEIILSTNNSADVLNYANKNNQITLYFLDINLHEKFISGIDIANVIRETDEISPIVLITNYSDKLSLTFEYKLKIFDYISKYDISNYEKRRVFFKFCVNTKLEEYSCKDILTKKITLLYLRRYICTAF